MKNNLILTLFLFCLLEATRSIADTGSYDEAQEFRIWTDARGRKAEAILLSVHADGKTIVLADRAKRQFSVPCSRLSKHDRTLVDAIRIKKPTGRPVGKVAFIQRGNADNAEPSVIRDNSDLLDDPDIENAIRELREKNTIRKTETVMERRKIMQKCYYRSGIFGRRICVAYVPRIVFVPRQTKKTFSNLQDGIGWDDQSDPRLGVADQSFDIPSLPSGAGARASNIEGIAIGLLPNTVSSIVTDDDKSLAINSTGEFSAVRSSNGRPRAYRVVAKVSGANSENVALTVMLQELNDNGDLSNNKVELTRFARELFTAIKNRITQ